MSPRMWKRLRSLLPGLLLIVAACTVLILTDRSRMRDGQADVRGPRPVRVAVIQFTNIAAFEIGRSALIAHLASVGYSTENGCTFDAYNPAGDMATLAQMCTQVVTASPRYDLVVTLGTATTQAFARTNTRGIPQVMAFVSSPPAIDIPMGPYIEGSGRPASLAGFGCLQPIAPMLEALRACDPEATRVGVAFNPAEPNAEASLKVARGVAPKLGLEIVEGNGASVTEVVNAVDAILASGVDALWLPPDTVVYSAATTIIRRATERGVPVITNFPELAAQGAQLNIGADWDTCGITTGMYAELLLRGADPRSLPVEDFAPQRVALDGRALPSHWRIPDALRSRAEQTTPESTAPESLRAALAAIDAQSDSRRTMPSIALLTYNRTPNFEECEAGFAEEWARLGYADGRNCRMRLYDAQFDSGTMNTMASAIAADRPDLVITFTTPALQTALRRMPDQMILFSLSASGVAAGAGTSMTDHLPNVTGVEVGSNWDMMIEVARAALPNLRRVGTVYSPSETNSVLYNTVWGEKLAKAGIELVSVGADKPTEMPEAADALAALDIDAILQISDNASSTGFASIVRAADRANLPVFGFAPNCVRLGAALSVSCDYRDAGRDTARVADRLLRGESPAGIPFSQPTTTRLLVNPARMQRYGITLPQSLLDQAVIMSGPEETTAPTATPTATPTTAPTGR